MEQDSLLECISKLKSYYILPDQSSDKGSAIREDLRRILDNSSSKRIYQLIEQGFDRTVELDIYTAIANTNHSNVILSLDADKKNYVFKLFFDHYSSISIKLLKKGLGDSSDRVSVLCAMLILSYFRNEISDSLLNNCLEIILKNIENHSLEKSEVTRAIEIVHNLSSSSYAITILEKVFDLSPSYIKSKALKALIPIVSREKARIIISKAIKANNIELCSMGIEFATQMNFKELIDDIAKHASSKNALLQKRVFEAIKKLDYEAYKRLEKERLEKEREERKERERLKNMMVIITAKGVEYVKITPYKSSGGCGCLFFLGFLVTDLYIFYKIFF